MERFKFILPIILITSLHPIIYSQTAGLSIGSASGEYLLLDFFSSDTLGWGFKISTSIDTKVFEAKEETTYWDPNKEYTKSGKFYRNYNIGIGKWSKEKIYIIGLIGLSKEIEYRYYKEPSGLFGSRTSTEIMKKNNYFNYGCEIGYYDNRIFRLGLYLTRYEGVGVMIGFNIFNNRNSTTNNNGVK